MAIVQGISSVGSCLGFSAVLPADEQLATYAALTYTPWEAITQIGDLGGVDDVSKVTPVCDGIVQKIHGPRDNGTQNMEALWDKDHAGQLLIRAAYPNRTRIAVEMTLADGATLYYIAIVTAAPITPGSASDILMIKPTLEITSSIVEDLS